MKEYQLPPETLIRSAQSQYMEMRRAGAVIYQILLLALLGLFISLPLVALDVYSTSRGMLQSGNGRLVLSLNTSGQVQRSAMQNKSYVEAGDTLLILDSKGLHERLAICQNRITEQEKIGHDLSLLLQARKELPAGSFQTRRYEEAYRQFQSEQEEFQLRVRNSRKAYIRYRHLLEKGVIARTDYESIQLEYRLATLGLHRFLHTRRSAWQEEAVESDRRLQDLHSERRQLSLEVRDFVLISPSQGHLVNIRAMEAGSFLPAATPVAELSVDAALFAECLISPRDMQGIRPGQPVSLVLDAYPAIRWGSLKAVITQVDQDVVYRDGLPVYRARCRIGAHSLRNRQGIQAALNKGMTLTAHFVIGRRTLWQLLFDKTDDWLVPGRERSRPEIFNPNVI